MPLLALPRAAVLIVRVARLDGRQARGADEDPIAVRLDADSVENIIGVSTTGAGFCANTFDFRHRDLTDFELIASKLVSTVLANLYLCCFKSNALRCLGSG